MTSISFHQTQVTELLHFFSSYLADTMSSICTLKKLVYQLIEVQLPISPPQHVAPDIHQVMATCKKSYDDLKRTECILRGHVKAKEGSRFRSLSQPDLRNRDSRAEARFSRFTIGDQSRPETPIRVETKTTLVTQPTESSRKQYPKMTQTQEEISFQLDHNFIQKEPPTASTVPNPRC